VNYWNAKASFDRMVKNARLSDITPYCPRHTHATALLRHGWSAKEVAERLGDNVKTIMETYAHVLPDMPD